MIKLRETLAVAIIVTVSASTLFAEPFIIHVAPAFAPNGSSRGTGQVSPSWASYVQNAQYALPIRADLVGDRETNPDAYEVVGEPISLIEMIHTEFPSWQASADPSDTWASLPSAFENELGNRVHFGLHIRSTGTRDFALQELSWQLDSNDETDFFDQSGSFANANYSSSRVGVNWGADGLPGGDDDIVYSNGESGSLRVNALTYVGVGEGFFSQEPNPASNQDDIDETLRSLLRSCEDCSFDLSGIYTLSDPMGGNPTIASGSIEVLIEPGLGGDHNRNGQLDCGDLDMMTREIAAGSNDILFDMNRDGLVSFGDLEISVRQKHNTYFGDANCDGEFNSSDLVQVFVSGLYETVTFGRRRLLDR